MTGYVNGHPQYRDDGPAVGRTQGHGGAALGYFTGTTVQPMSRDERRARQAAAKRRRKAASGRGPA